MTKVGRDYGGRPPPNDAAGHDARVVMDQGKGPAGLKQRLLHLVLVITVRRDPLQHATVDLADGMVFRRGAAIKPTSQTNVPPAARSRAFEMLRRSYDIPNHTIGTRYRGRELTARTTKASIWHDCEQTIVLVQDNPATDAAWDDLIEALGRDGIVRLSPPKFGALLRAHWSDTLAIAEIS
jgi:hypothetical protein